MIDVICPAAVRMTSSDTTLSETIFSIVPGKRFRMLVLMVLYGIRNERQRKWQPVHSRFATIDIEHIAQWSRFAGSG